MFTLISSDGQLSNPQIQPRHRTCTAIFTNNIQSYSSNAIFTNNIQPVSWTTIFTNNIKPVSLTTVFINNIKPVSSTTIFKNKIKPVSTPEITHDGKYLFAQMLLVIVRRRISSFLWHFQGVDLHSINLFRWFFLILKNYFLKVNIYFKKIKFYLLLI